MPKTHIPMAIAYDFDGTLAPGNAQEPQFIPDIGMKPKDFWAKVDQLSIENQADKVLTYMRLMLEKARESRVPVRRQDFLDRGSAITLFEGVQGWFDRIDKYGKEYGVRVKHYVVSSGNAELIEGTSISSKFEGIYASRFMFDENGVAIWPAQALKLHDKDAISLQNQ